MQNLTQEQRDLLSSILNYVLETEESHFEESGCPDNHIYALARKAKLEFNLDNTHA